MPNAKPLAKERILAAMSQTLSNKAAARYLHVSYTHYKKWAKTYDATEKGYNNLFEQHLQTIPNDFVCWIIDSIGDYQLAELLAMVDNKKKFLIRLSDHLEMLHDAAKDY